ncbi:MAG TPA: LanC-like protein, partial [Kofleriaceae bacterium]|nr:LanC-like protein [Kofleriaceae bacterium]
MELFDPARHQPLSGTWDEADARAAIAAIVAETEAAFDPERLWPPHPGDGDAGRTTLYMGAAGVMFALARLGGDWRAALATLPARYRAQPDTGEAVPSYFLGEVGLLAAAGAEPERMAALIEANLANPTLEALWGAPGTMLPALWRFRAGGEPRWRDLWLANARHLIDTWIHHDDPGCHLWTQDLYGEVVRLLGAGHGFAGNVFALAAGLDVLPPADAALVVDRAVATLAATAIRRDGLTNWLPHVGRPRRGREPILVQWCHGAPGMITGLAALPPSPELDALLAEGGELTWAAGPLAKGPGLCHGTAGNGYAFLVLHARSRDPRWLVRARAFAAHAIGQYRVARAEHGRGR